MSSSLSIECFDRLDAIAPADWQQLSAGRAPFLAEEWLRYAPAPGPLQLFAAIENGRVVGALPVYRVDAPGHYYHTPRDIICGQRERALLESTAERERFSQLYALDWFPCAISVSPFGYRGGVLSAAAKASGRVVTALLQSANLWCREQGIGFLLHYGLNQADDGVMLQVLQAAALPPFLVGAYAELPVRWSSLAEYHRCMRGRGRRLRAEYRRASRTPMLEWQSFTRPGERWLPQDTRSVVELIAAHARSHGDSNPPEMLYYGLLEEWRGTVHLLVARQAASIRSALVVLEHQGTFYPKFFGSSVRDDYFHLTYGMLLELAITRGIRRIAYGGGSHATKLLRGATLVPAFAALHVEQPQLRPVFAIALAEYAAAKQRYFGALTARYERRLA